MNSLPPQHRGVGGGMNSTFMNSAQVLSIGIFFTLMIIGLTGVAFDLALPRPHQPGRLPRRGREGGSHLPPVATLFAAFLGYSPIQHLLGAGVLDHLPPDKVALLTSRSYFPHLIAKAFQQGLHEAFDFAVLACLVAAGASWMRGGKYVYRDPEGSTDDLVAHEIEETPFDPAAEQADADARAAARARVVANRTPRVPASNGTNGANGADGRPDRSGGPEAPGTTVPSGAPAR